jgi:hypothetical protein
MGSITAEVVDTGEKRDQRGRRVTPLDRQVELVRAYQASGLTQAGFVRREGLCYSTFAGWVQKHSRFAKVKFAELRLPAAPPAAGLEVQLVDGTIVRGATVTDLVGLVRALRG